jgi:hypothetical protein
MVNAYACVAIYEPNPFRPSVIKEAIESAGRKSSSYDTGYTDNQWCWVYYDWCGNPVGLSEDLPEGRLVYRLKPEYFEWMGYENAVRFCEYLNKEPNQEMKNKWYEFYGEDEGVND